MRSPTSVGIPSGNDRFSASAVALNGAGIGFPQRSCKAEGKYVVGNGRDPRLDARAVVR